jgi:succinate-semialdehyde dehydrogenase/glutarate-semialdehyde dehydrogenase
MEIAAMNDRHDIPAHAAQEAAHPLIGGEHVAGKGAPLTVLDKYLLVPGGTVTTPDRDQVHQAIDLAQQAFLRGAPSPFDRGAVLEKASVLVGTRLADFVRTMQMEAGFTASDASGEVRRCAETLRLSAEEARRLGGDVIPLEGAPNQAGRIGFTLRVPLGVVAAITPFNSPLNTVAHKVAPALAAGNAVILKPSSATPFTALLLADVLMEAGVPRGFLSVLPGSTPVANALLADERVRFFAFTGSTDVGRLIQQAAGLRRTQMELGSIAFTLLCDDADLGAALPKVVSAAYRKAGQVCTSIQILLVHAAIVGDVQARLEQEVGALPFGDPRKADTVCGPVISEAEAIRIDEWIRDATSRGAKLLAGGQRKGSVVPPTLLTGVDDSMAVGCREIFGPVMCIVPFSTLDEAIARVNATPYGLATGVFTNRLADAFAAARRLQVGGVHVNETSSSRVDLMPYGGSKDSGFGREGPRYAVHEMTEERIVTFALGR